MIKGVRLDVGDTLVTPRGGRWNPRFDFEDTLAAFGIVYQPAAMTRAISAGEEYLNRANAKGTRDEYHRAILGVLEVGASPELLKALDRPLPFSELIDVFPDVLPALQTMKSSGLALGIVSDTGPGARRLYEEFGWTDYFSAYAISAEVGCCKPDPLMYRTASDALGLAPEECVFIDNDCDCLQGALDLGYQVYGISRYGDPPEDRFTWIQGMAELLDLLGVSRSHS